MPRLTLSQPGHFHARALDDPTARLKPLQHELAGLWRLRVGDYRVILDVRRDDVVIVALDLGHRSDIYDRAPAARSRACSGQSVHDHSRIV